MASNDNNEIADNTGVTRAARIIAEFEEESTVSTSNSGLTTSDRIVAEFEKEKETNANLLPRRERRLEEEESEIDLGRVNRGVAAALYDSSDFPANQFQTLRIPAKFRQENRKVATCVVLSSRGVTEGKTVLVKSKST